MDRTSRARQEWKILSGATEMSTGSRSLGSQIFPAISAGLVTGLVNVILCISLAALIFRGDVAPFTANAIGFILLGCTAPVLITGIFSSYEGAIVLARISPPLF